MDSFQLPVVKTTWAPGDTREVETTRLDRQINVEYDSYRRVYIADGHEWMIVGQMYYILECTE